MARILVLRPEAEAADMVARLRKLGHEPLILPLHEIVQDGAPPPDGSFSGFIVTSAHAVAPLAAAFPRDARPVLAVGERTAGVLRTAGFGNVVVGEGEGTSLVPTARRVFAAAGLPLLYAAGRVRTSGLETALLGERIGLVIWEVYDTRPLHPDSGQLFSVLGRTPPDAVLLLSTGQARAYGDLAGENPLLLNARTRLVCLSKRIADALSMELRPHAEISDGPTLDALFDLIR